MNRQEHKKGADNGVSHKHAYTNIASLKMDPFGSLDEDCCNSGFSVNDDF